MCANVSAYDQGNLAPPISPQLPDGLSRKRAFEGGDENGGGVAKRIAKSPDIIFRLLVPTSKIGKVIGKQGAQIKQLREETGAHIKIADPVSALEDRVIFISSKDENAVESRSAAEYALFRVATIVLEESRDNNSTTKIGPQLQGGPNLTRLLICRSQAGCLIGKGGAIAREIREITGASVWILPPEQLPLCSYASETDQLVQISGELVQVQKGLEVISSKLRGNPPWEAVTLRPTYYFGTQPQMMLTQAALSGFAVQPFGNDNGFAALGAAVSGSLNSQAATIVPVPTISKVTAEMSVPCALIGGIIGKGGVNITQIRAISGCAVKVFGRTEGAAERTIAFEGTAEQVSAAQSLVQAFMNAQ